MFQQYKPFNASFQDSYRLLFERYPHAGMVLDKELRNLAAGDEIFMRQNVGKLARPNPVKAALLEMSLRLPMADGPSHYLKLGSFKTLSEAIAAELSARGLRSFSDQRVLGFARNKQLHALTVRGRQFKRALRRGLAKGMDVMAQEEAIIAALDTEILANRDAVLRYLDASRIRVIVSDGDCMYFSRVIAEAAKELGIPFAVIAHGYVQNPYLATIAPIFGDMFVAWTEGQVAALAASIDAEDVPKLHHFGFPKVPELTTTRQPGRVLMVWNPLVLHGGSRAVAAADVARIATALAGAGLKPVLRMHPRDRRDPVLQEAFDTAGLERDHDLLGAALGRSDVVLGSFSSVLVEAAATGRPVLQFSDAAPFRFESLPEIARDDPTLADRLKAMSGATNTTFPPFDVPAFCDALCARIPAGTDA